MIAPPRRRAMWGITARLQRKTPSTLIFMTRCQVGDRRVDDGAKGEHRGVVEENVDAAVGRQRGLHHLAHLRLIGDVGLDKERLPASR